MDEPIGQKYELPPFGRDFFSSDFIASIIGTGSIGGKAAGLISIKNTIEKEFPDHKFKNIEITIPRFVVIATDIFDRFMLRNNLTESALSGKADQFIANDFQKAEFPAEFVGDLRGLIESVRKPLAVRSSSMLEDSMYKPFAGVYFTKMIPNNQPDTDTRFRRLVEAIRLIYASVYFRNARDYHRAAGIDTADEKMAVIIQEVVGETHYERFYPNLSGVARSYNYYPMGRAKPEQGVVDLALGLGKTIVDGGRSWTYCPAMPRVAPPTGSPAELVKISQNKFWAISLERPNTHDPIRETEYMVHAELPTAEYDNTLKDLVSTYRREDDRLVIGMGSPGARVLTFAPLLNLGNYPFNDLVKHLLKICPDAVGAPVEIEFAMTFDPQGKRPARFGFLQVRPMVVSDEEVTVDDNELQSDKLLVASNHVLGNGTANHLKDVIFVPPDTFDVAKTPQIAEELSQLNRNLIDAGKHYILIGFGRWGSSDPWLGIPVEWGMISNSRVIVEAALPDMNKEMSQGSHFFHNLTSFKVFYFSVPLAGPYRINWDKLKTMRIENRTENAIHAVNEEPLLVKVDGRLGRGVILHD